MLPPVLPPTSKQFSVTLEAARQDILKVYAHRLFLKQQPSSFVCNTFILLFSYVFLFPSFQQLFLTENREQILVVNCTKVLSSLAGKQKHIKRYQAPLCIYNTASSFPILLLLPQSQTTVQGTEFFHLRGQQFIGIYCKFNLLEQKKVFS